MGRQFTSCSRRVMKETSVRVDGINSPLLKAGPRESVQAVVFVHGNPGSIADWTRLVAGVGEFARAVAMDMPGFGSADKPEAFDYSVGGYARHLGRALIQGPVERAHFSPPSI